MRQDCRMARICDTLSWNFMPNPDFGSVRSGAKLTFSDFDPINQRNLKALENGGTIEFLQSGKVIAIGHGHKEEVVTFARAGAKGTIKITKGVLADPGTLEVHGSIDRTAFKDAMKRISKKKVQFA
jgi:hypothetical protein